MDKISIGLQLVQFKDGGMSLKTLIFANLQISKAKTVFLQSLMDMEEINVLSSAKKI
jgi:hypothetical protein